MWGVESGFKIDKDVKCVDLLIPCLLQQLAQRKDLVYGGFARFETTMIRTNQFVDGWFQSLTQNARQAYICNREQTYATIIASDYGIVLFEYWAEKIKTPITWHAFQ